MRGKESMYIYVYIYLYTLKEKSKEANTPSGCTRQYTPTEYDTENNYIDDTHSLFIILR